MSEIDQQFIEYVVKSLVGKPDAVQIKRTIDEKGVLLELTVDPEDLGRVIGKRGATAQSLRTLLRALGTKNDARYNLKIIDNGTPPPAKPAQDQDQPAQTDDAATDESVSQPEEPVEPTAEPAEPTEPAEESAEETPAETENEPAEADQIDAEPQPADNDSNQANKEDQTSDRLAKARAELADLDDLDI